MSTNTFSDYDAEQNKCQHPDPHAQSNAFIFIVETEYENQFNYLLSSWLRG